MAKRLRDAAEAFATHRHHLLADLGRLFLGDCLDVVADEADRALGLDRDRLGEREERFDLVDQFGELLVAAEDDVLLLEVRGEHHVAERIDPGDARVVVAATATRVLAATDRPVRDVDDVLERAPHHALRAGIGTATLRHDAGDRLAVRGDALLGRFQLLVVDHQVLRTVLLRFLWVDLKHFLNQCFGFFAIEHAHFASPLQATVFSPARRRW
ncbi:hypothetical protein SDC9_176508 [bioreactor metagenome]|uniref:NAD-specific glutamate dehydrogenase n=1 Tax=bioreactor metagenome TaxID=1076179 RepID=A0A645GS11_9ZZZZ